MKMSERHAITTKPWETSDPAHAGVSGWTATWVNPLDGKTTRRHADTEENAVKNLKAAFKPVVHVNDRTIPFYKFWKRKCIR